MSRSISAKQQAAHIRQTVDRDALAARDASYASQAPRTTVDPDFKLVSAYRNALGNWAHDCPDVDGFAIVERFNADIGLSDNIVETIQEWQAWACEIMDAIEKHDEVQVALDKMSQSAGRGTAGNHLGQTFLVIDRDDAQEVIDRLKGGPAIGGEGIELDDPNYLPFSGKDEDREDEEEKESAHWRAHACPNGHGGQCGYFDYFHGPNNECPRDASEADRFHQQRMRRKTT